MLEVGETVRPSFDLIEWRFDSVVALQFAEAVVKGIGDCVGVANLKKQAERRVGRLFAEHFHPHFYMERLRLAPVEAAWTAFAFPTVQARRFWAIRI